MSSSSPYPAATLREGGAPTPMRVPAVPGGRPEKGLGPCPEVGAPGLPIHRPRLSNVAKGDPLVDPS